MCRVRWSKPVSNPLEPGSLSHGLCSLMCEDRFVEGEPPTNHRVGERLPHPPDMEPLIPGAL